MLWAAACTGFFCFLRAGEFTVPSAGAYDREVHLSLNDLATDCHSNPSLFRVRIKQSKTDPFRQVVDVYLGATGTAICPVHALWAYLEKRGPSLGPLFLFHSGTQLTRAAFGGSSTFGTATVRPGTYHLQWPQLPHRSGNYCS